MFSGLMLNAWESASIVAVVAGVVGFFIVLRGSAFAAHALPNGAFAGAAGASLIGVDAIVGLAVFSILGALTIAGLGRRARHDVATALVIVVMLGLGSLFLSMTTEYAPEIYSLLFGEVLGVSSSELVPIAVIGVVCIVAVLLVYRPLMFSSVMPDVAEARGVGSGRMEVVFLLVVALTTTMAVPVVGALLIFSLLISPAAAARSFTRPAVHGDGPVGTASRSAPCGRPSRCRICPIFRSASSSARSVPGRTPSAGDGPAWRRNRRASPRPSAAPTASSTARRAKIGRCHSDPRAERSRPFGLIGALILAVLGAACASVAAAGPVPLPRRGDLPAVGQHGAGLDRRVSRRDPGGADGRTPTAASPATPISLDLRDVEDQSQIPAAVASLHADGVPVVIGAYSSQLSIPAAAAVSAAGMVYWETGAVADRVTGQGSPLVFRVGVNGAELGAQLREVHARATGAAHGHPGQQDPRVLRHRRRRLRSLASPTRPAPRSRPAACTSAASPSTTRTRPTGRR